MRSRRILAIACLLLLAVAGSVSGRQAAGSDDPENTAENRRRLLEELAQGKTQLPGRPTPGTTETSTADDPMLPVAPRPTALEGATKEKYEQALREYYDYHISGLHHRSKVFKWQLFSSRLIFAAVLLLVLAGIYFAAVQFHAGLRKPPPRPGEGEGTTELSGKGEGTTEISASLEGIKVSSPVLGVVILVISLAFFYLYLIYIYPIENIF